MKMPVNHPFRKKLIRLGKSLANTYYDNVRHCADDMADVLFNSQRDLIAEREYAMARKVRPRSR
jgi:hypothetical protein